MGQCVGKVYPLHFDIRLPYFWNSHSPLSSGQTSGKATALFKNSTGPTRARNDNIVCAKHFRVAKLVSSTCCRFVLAICPIYVSRHHIPTNSASEHLCNMLKLSACGTKSCMCVSAFQSGECLSFRTKIDLEGPIKQAAKYAARPDEFSAIARCSESGTCTQRYIS